MSKRKAATDLNHDNWDREEEPEVAGTFQEAPKEVVQDRVIRTAKRRLQAGANASPGGGGSGNNEPKKLFSGFSGFGAMKSSGTPSSVSEIAKNSFSFLKKSDTSLKINTVEMKNDSEKGDAQQTYLARLRGLNEAVLDWIKQHVESNPCCILTPVFRDYDNYLKEIQSEEGKSGTSQTNSNDSESGIKTASAPTFSLGSNNSNNVDKKSTPTILSFSSKEQPSAKPSTPSFNFGTKQAPEKASTPTFSFGAKESTEKVTSPPFLFTSSNTTGTATASFVLSSSKEKRSAPNTDSVLTSPPEKKPFFNFGSSSDKPALDLKFPSTLPGGGFTFGGINKPAESSGNNHNENSENDEEPPPEPVKPVTEDDALYTQRVKLFIKKGEGYSDLGVGNLFIKEAPNGWHQAIIRNDTSLGNIIFNILLSKQQPSKRLGTNNVMIVCQPTPQHSGPALPVLLRVKTRDDADKLLETLEKYKK